MTEPISQPLSGVLLVDKPYRLSSMSIVRVVKRRLMNSGLPKSIKVGHGGTLDPLASGLMVILVGKATKLCDQIMAGRKAYVAEVDLTRFSSTDDLEGEMTPVDVATPPTIEQIHAILPRFIGTIMQRPPNHSAVWIDGKRAYDIARKGETPDIKSRLVEVLSIDVAKTPNLMVAVARDFFPRLVPGHSIVLNQDYIFPHQPWVIIAMELLADCFEPFCEPPRETTMVHRLTKPISASLVQERLGTSGADFYTTENIGLIERARDRLSRTNNQASLQGAYAFALFRGGFVDEARAAARRMVTDYEVTSETFEQKSAFKRLYSELRLELPSI